MPAMLYLLEFDLRLLSLRKGAHLFSDLDHGARLSHRLAHPLQG